MIVPPPPTKTKGMIWLETVSEEVYQQTLTNMYEEVKKITAFNIKSHANNAAIYTNILVKKLKKIDRSKLSTEQKRNLASIIFAGFPQAVARMETQLTDLSRREYASEIYGDYLRKLMSEYLDTMPHKLPIPNQLTEVTPESEKQAVETVGSDEADVKLAEVKKLAAEAYKVATTTEDRFFAEQAANSYIPDAVRMLAGLIHAPDDMKTEANEIFLKQLEILETQLKNVVGRAAGESLSALKAHTEFLKSKNESTNENVSLD